MGVAAALTNNRFPLKLRSEYHSTSLRSALIRSASRRTQGNNKHHSISLWAGLAICHSSAARSFYSGTKNHQTTTFRQAQGKNHQIKCSPIFLLRFPNLAPLDFVLGKNHQIKSSPIFLLRFLNLSLATPRLCSGRRLSPFGCAQGSAFNYNAVTFF